MTGVRNVLLRSSQSTRLEFRGKERLSLVVGICLLLSMLIQPQAGAAEEDTTSTIDLDLPTLEQRWREGRQNVLSDARYLATFPTRPTKRGVLWTAGVLGIIGVVMTYDERIRVEALQHRSSTTDRWESTLEPFGRGSITYVLGPLVYAGGRVFDNEVVTETGRTLIETLVFTEVATATAKFAFGRTEPPWGKDPVAGNFFDSGHRFPSGHVSRAFAIAAVLEERHGAGAGWISYPVATLVGLGRIEKNRHWASDVVAGAALGWVIGKTVARRRAEREATRRLDGEPRIQMLVTPLLSFDRRAAGMQVMMSF